MNRKYWSCKIEVNTAALSVNKIEVNNAALSVIKNKRSIADCVLFVLQIFPQKNTMYTTETEQTNAHALIHPLAN